MPHLFVTSRLKERFCSDTNVFVTFNLNTGLQSCGFLDLSLKERLGLGGGLPSRWQQGLEHI